MGSSSVPSGQAPQSTQEAFSAVGGQERVRRVGQVGAHDACDGERQGRGDRAPFQVGIRPHFLNPHGVPLQHVASHRVRGSAPGAQAMVAGDGRPLHLYFAPATVRRLCTDIAFECLALKCGRRLDGGDSYLHPGRIQNQTPAKNVVGL